MVSVGNKSLPLLLLALMRNAAFQSLTQFKTTEHQPASQHPRTQCCFALDKLEKTGDFPLEYFKLEMIKDFAVPKIFLELFHFI